MNRIVGAAAWQPDAQGRLQWVGRTTAAAPPPQYTAGQLVLTLRDITIQPDTIPAGACVPILVGDADGLGVCTIDLRAYLGAPPPGRALREKPVAYAIDTCDIAALAPEAEAEG